MVWKLIARVAHYLLADKLIALARKTPYTHIHGPRGDLYMERFWLFNPYTEEKTSSWLPSIRIHHILRHDMDQHMHDHPWNARTIVLKGWYVEQRRISEFYDKTLIRFAGQTAAIKFGEYHRIAAVSPGGVWTLWITWKYRGTWGFLVNGRKVPWKQYLAGVR